MREPSQVFTLLETIYNEVSRTQLSHKSLLVNCKTDMHVLLQFDRVAKVRKVFKVETVGDCYVAVAGLPDPRSVRPFRLVQEIFFH